MNAIAKYIISQTRDLEAARATGNYAPNAYWLAHDHDEISREAARRAGEAVCPHCNEPLVDEACPDSTCNFWAPKGCPTSPKHTTYKNDAENARRVGWDLLPEHCEGDASAPFVTHDTDRGIFVFHCVHHDDPLDDDPLGDWHGRNE